MRPAVCKRWHNECNVCVCVCVSACVCVGGFFSPSCFQVRQQAVLDVQHKPVLECVRVFRYVCRRSTFARHMALSCPGTALGSPDVLLFYHPPLAPCSLRFRESVSPAFNLLCCVCGFFCLFFCLFPVTNKPLEALCCFLFFNFLVFFPTWKHFLKINVLGLLVIAVHILWKEIILNYHIWVFSLIFVNILKCLSHLMCRLLRTDTFIVETVTLLLFK